ncbi:hypothetical protein [Mesorhizobium sp. M2C.T.Ca.TU.002.02.1.1]|uniref:hypothetical protein n=1 Tax=Mesorhizobium sp. M2C.T.Ca.TU.002.02.1.1 TaxID=2496788 RepID=UPI000FCB5000|nr:hypothetical protein [Mesorhizobium sp. M2C.T.Ca.TU.002.02.1.1]RUU58239.1 hypothetical protein EOD07_10570 [Mesorhizobium sp. M2C.T.Ca.TU.002.02.1.1]RUU71610.1 hypothetical protein EOD04_02110 [Mesorhizobium sp. M2C.T.Ca.TU.009.01.2.1]
MSEPFDPIISSSKYLAVARERHRAGTIRLREELAWMLDDEAYDCGLNREHVYVLTNPLNWSAAVRNANRKARVFLDARINQRGNAEIGWTRGDHEILYDEDFLAGYAEAAQRHDAVPWRSLGELMWWKGYEMMASHAILRQSPSATALLYAHAARLNDLATYLARHVTLVGAVTINFTYDEGHLSSVDFVPTIPPERMQEITRERRRRTGERMREAVERLVPKENDPE